MKTETEILKMNKKELSGYKWSEDLDLKEEGNSNCFVCTNCSNCSYCSFCTNCSNCSYCYLCRNLKDGKKHQYKICNIQLTKKEYEKKIRELENENPNRKRT